MSFLNCVLLGMAILTIVEYTFVSPQIIKDDPNTWICKNKSFNHPEVIKAAMDACKPRGGACKNLCVFQTWGVLDAEFKLDEEKTKSQVRIFLDDKDAEEVGRKFIPCGKHLKVNDTDVNCAGNHDFLTCGRHAVTEVCQVPLGSFGYPDE